MGRERRKRQLDLMERKLGEIFEYNGEWYQCVIGHCNQCCFDEAGTCKFIRDPHCAYRNDKKLACFKKLEKVGEPYRKRVSDGTFSTFQRYRVYNSVILPKEPYIYCNFIDNTIEIEIKQNKEDMEEKGQCCDNRFEIIAKAKEALLKETNIARDEKEMAVIDNILFRCWQMGWLDKYDDTKHSNSEKIGKNLKPFDLQKAREGKPVCTRDGRKARIICFDAKGDQPIIALVTMDNGKEFIETYHLNGRFNDDDKTESGGDLMMLPEKKEGWVNLYPCDYMGQKRYSTKEEALKKALSDVIATIKISWEE